MNNTIKMLILSVIAGGVLMISAGANAEVDQQDNNVVATQDLGVSPDAGLNLSDDSSSDNWWGGWYGGWGGLGYGWGWPFFGYGLGWGGWYGGFGGCCGGGWWW